MRSFLECDTGGNNRSFDSTGPSKNSLRWHKTVLNVFLFAQGWQCHDYFKWLAISSENDDLDLTFGDFFKNLVDSLSDLL